ncbi:MAG: MATE family efflux transporter [Rikenellaceae bacterium]
MSTEKENKLISDGVAKALVSFTIPIFFALLLQVMYGAIDMFIVGNFAQINDVSGVSTGSQLINFLTSVCAGLAMGTTILVGQKRGEKMEGEIGGVIANSIALFFGISIVIMVVMLIFRDSIVAGMNTPEEAIYQTGGYIFYSAIGVPMIFAYNVLGSIFRGLGDSKTPLLAVAIACVANIIGDLVLVAHCGMGASGAAIATVGAQTISVIISVYIIRKRSLLNYSMGLRTFKVNWATIKRVVWLGVPVALQSGLTALSFLFVMVVVNKFGVVFSAAVGVSEKLVSSILLIPMAFMQSISVFVAQNFGANDLYRTKRGLRVGIIISGAAGVFMAYMCYFHGDMLLGIFTQDPQVIEAACSYIDAYVFEMFVVPILFCLTGYLNGYGATIYVMIQGIVGAIALRLSLTFVFSLIEPVSLFRIGLATPIATAVQVVMCLYFIHKIDQKIKHNTLYL